MHGVVYRCILYVCFGFVCGGRMWCVYMQYVCGVCVFVWFWGVESSLRWLHGEVEPAK